MYTATLASWVASIISQFRSLTTIKSHLIKMSSLDPSKDCFMQQLVEDFPGYCTTFPAAHPLVCIGMGALMFNVHKDSQYHAQVALLTIPWVKVSNCITVCSVFFKGNFCIFAIGVLLASNSTATLLVGYKTWQVLVSAPAFDCSVL